LLLDVIIAYTKSRNKVKNIVDPLIHDSGLLVSTANTLHACIHIEEL